MKNKLLSFIRSTDFFLQSRIYSLQETLDFCSLLNYEKEVKGNKELFKSRSFFLTKFL